MKRKRNWTGENRWREVAVTGDFSSIYRRTSTPETLHALGESVEESSSAEHVLDDSVATSSDLHRYFLLVEASG